MMKYYKKLLTYFTFYLPPFYKMYSSSVSQKFPRCDEEEARNIHCVYCRRQGFFFKNGDKMWGKHHVKFCCKAQDRNNAKRAANGRKPTFTKEVDSDGVTWKRKRSGKKNKTRVTSGAKIVMEKSKDPFSLLGAMDAKAESERLKKSEKAESERLKREAKLKLMKETEAKEILAAAAEKQVPQPSTKKPKALGGWLAVAKAKKPVAKKKPKTEIPFVAKSKRVKVLKKEAKVKPSPTVFKKGTVLSFEKMKEMFSNTDSWGDSSDDDC